LSFPIRRHGNEIVGEIDPGYNGSLVPFLVYLTRVETLMETKKVASISNNRTNFIEAKHPGIHYTPSIQHPSKHDAKKERLTSQASPPQSQVFQLPSCTAEDNSCTLEIPPNSAEDKFKAREGNLYGHAGAAKTPPEPRRSLDGCDWAAHVGSTADSGAQSHQMDVSNFLHVEFLLRVDAATPKKNEEHCHC
jgi:hypothetical protein